MEEKDEVVDSDLQPKLCQCMTTHALKDLLHNVIIGNGELLVKHDNCLKQLAKLEKSVAQTNSLCDALFGQIQKDAEAFCSWGSVLTFFSREIQTLELRIDEQKRVLLEKEGSSALEKDKLATLKRKIQMLELKVDEQKESLSQRDVNIEDLAERFSQEKYKSVSLKWKRQILKLTIGEQERLIIQKDVKIENLARSLALEKDNSAILSKDVLASQKCHSGVAAEPTQCSSLHCRRKDNRLVSYGTGASEPSDLQVKLNEKKGISSKLNPANKSFTMVKTNHASLEKQRVPRQSFMYDKEVTPMNQFGVFSYSTLGMILPLASLCLDRTLTHPSFQQFAVRSTSFVISLMAAYVAKRSVEEHKSGWIVKCLESIMCSWDVVFCLVALVYTVFRGHLSQPLEKFQSIMLISSLVLHIAHFLWNYFTAEEEPEERLPLLG